MISNGVYLFSAIRRISFAGLSRGVLNLDAGHTLGPLEQNLYLVTKFVSGNNLKWRCHSSQNKEKLLPGVLSELRN